MTTLCSCAAGAPTSAHTQGRTTDSQQLGRDGSWSPVPFIDLSGFAVAIVVSTDPRRLVLLILVYPILEEVVFRGALQGWLRKKTWGLRNRSDVTVANILTSIVFAAFHFIRQPNIWSAGVVLPGLIFGFFRDRYGNLYAPIALYIFYNSGLTWLFRV